MKILAFHLTMVLMLLVKSDHGIAQPHFTGDTLRLRFDSWSGVGFSPGGGEGRLDSQTWVVSGLTDGSMNFNDTKLGGDFGRGESAGQVTTGGVYAFKPSDQFRVLGFQPTGTDLAPGSLTLRFQIADGIIVNTIGAAFDIWYLNDQGRSTAVDVEWSLDDVSYHPFIGGSLSTPAAADSEPTWALKSTMGVADISVGTQGTYLYIRWNMKDAGGIGSRDEWGIEEVRIFKIEGGDTTPVPVYSTLVKFDFDDESDQSTAGYFEQFDAKFDLIRANRNGYATGSPGRSANSNGWANLNGAWIVRLSTVGYKDLAVQSKQYSSATGPRDFMLEWSDDSLQWRQLTTYQVKNSFSDLESGRGFLLPVEAEGKPKIYLRWRNYSNASAEDRNVSNAGSSRIDEISVTGLFDSFSPPILAYPVVQAVGDRIEAQIEVLSHGTSLLTHLAIHCNQTDGDSAFSTILPKKVREIIRFQSDSLPRPSSWSCYIEAASDAGETRSGDISVSILPPPSQYADMPGSQAKDIRMVARTDTTLNIQWQKGDGEFSLLAWVPPGVSTCGFDLGKTYIAHPYIREGELTTHGCRVIWTGSGNHAKVFGLSPLETASFTVVEFNGESGREHYLEQDQEFGTFITRAQSPDPMGDFNILVITHEMVTFTWGELDINSTLLVIADDAPNKAQLLKFLDDDFLSNGIDLMRCEDKPCTITKSVLGERKLFGYAIAGPPGHQSIQSLPPSELILDWIVPELGQPVLEWEFDDQIMSPSWALWEHQNVTVTVEGARDRGFATGYKGFASYTDQWHDPDIGKAWVISLSTHGMSQAIIELRVVSSASGPASFQVFCGTFGGYVASDDTIVASSAWNQTQPQRVNLPMECLNRDFIQVRITPSEDMSINGDVISRSGTSRIDDFKIFGTFIKNTEPLMGTLKLLANNDNGIILEGEWLSAAGQLPKYQYLKIGHQLGEIRKQYALDGLVTEFHIKELEPARVYSITHCGVTDWGESCSSTLDVRTPDEIPPSPQLLSVSIVEPDSAMILVHTGGADIVAFLATHANHPPVWPDSGKVSINPDDSFKIIPRQSGSEPILLNNLRPGASYKVWIAAVNGPDSTARYSSAPYPIVKLDLPPLQAPSKPIISIELIERDFRTVSLAIQNDENAHLLFILTPSGDAYENPDDDTYYIPGISYNSGDVIGLNGYVVGPVEDGNLLIRGLPLGSKWTIRGYVYRELHGAVTYSRQFVEHTFETVPNPQIDSFSASQITSLTPGDTVIAIGNVLWHKDNQFIVHIKDGNIRLRFPSAGTYQMHDFERVAFFGTYSSGSIEVLDYFEIEPDPLFRVGQVVVHPDSSNAFAKSHPKTVVSNLLRTDAFCVDGSPMFHQRGALRRNVCIEGLMNLPQKGAFLNEWVVIAYPIYSEIEDTLTLFTDDEANLLPYQSPKAVLISPNKGQIITWSRANDTSVDFSWRLEDAVRPFDHFPDSLRLSAKFITRTIDHEIVLSESIDVGSTSISMTASELHRIHGRSDSLNLNIDLDWTVALFDEFNHEIDINLITNWQPFQLLRLKALADTDLVEIPDTFLIEPARPNPFNPTTTIRVHIPNSGRFELVAFDVLGRQVATVFNNNLNAGVHDLIWDASRLPSGVYLLRSRYDRMVQTLQVTLVK